MKHYSSIIRDHLESTAIRTWFDLGQFLDQLKSTPPKRLRGSIDTQENFLTEQRKGIGFITYSLDDGSVTQAMRRYAGALRQITDQTTPIHWIAGEISPAGQSTMGPRDIAHELPSIQGFERWGELYRLLYHRKIKRGDTTYNELPAQLWTEAKTICYSLLDYIEAHNLQLLLAANVASNPGNLSLTLALAVIGELYDIPIIAANHHFYWEGAYPKGSKRRGPRNHFFKNAETGEIFSLIQMLYPWCSANWLHFNQTTEQHNKVITDLGANPFNVMVFSDDLKQDFSQAFERLWLIQQNRETQQSLAAQALASVLHGPTQPNSDLIYDRNRTYIPGDLKLRFLSHVKSINDPSYFRIEEKQTLSEIFTYATSLIPQTTSTEQSACFYYGLECLFRISKGTYSTELDTTFDYRYRDNRIFLWRELTKPQLFEAISTLALKIFGPTHHQLSAPEIVQLISRLTQDSIFTNQLTKQLIHALSLEIDPAILKASLSDNAALAKAKRQIIKQLKTPMVVDNIKVFRQRIVERPQRLVILPGNKNQIIWELFALDHLLAHWNKKKKPYYLTFACREGSHPLETTLDELTSYVTSDSLPHLKLAAEHHRINVIPLGSKSTAINLKQISPELTIALRQTKRTNGHVIAKGEDNYFSLDLLDIDSFRYGNLRSKRAQGIFGAPASTPFLQFVPAGLRTYFGFPLTVETPVQFAKALSIISSGRKPKETKRLLKRLKIYLDQHGTTLRDAITKMSQPKKPVDSVSKRLAGKYDDGEAWTGALVSLTPNQRKHSYHILSAKKNKTLPQFINTVERRIPGKIIMGWNGGYILNYELVSKLKLSDEFIGTPIGFIMSNRRVLSLPLFNRPVFAIRKSGTVFIDRLSFNFSGRIFHKQKLLFDWNKTNINPTIVPSENVAAYSPMSGRQSIPATNRIIVVLCGHKIWQVLYPEDHQSAEVSLFSAGITFSLPKNMRHQVAQLTRGTEVRFDLDLPAPWSKVSEAMEGGPFLINNGRHDMDLERGGWLLDHSIRTQASKVDKENIRGPRIGCGLTKSGKLICAVIESRIRDSVGATYRELAHILIEEGVVIGMGFDSGGSASLWTAGEGMVNIVPFADTFNEQPLAGKPTPRPIANAILVQSTNRQPEAR